MDEIDRHDFRLPSEVESGVPFLQKSRRRPMTSLSAEPSLVDPAQNTVNYKGPQEWIKNSVKGKDGHYYDRATGALTASASQVELAKTLGTAKPRSANGDVTDEILKTVRAPGSAPEIRKAIAIPPTAVPPVTAPTRPGSAMDILSGLEPPNFDAAASATVRPRINPSLLTSSPVFPVEQPAPSGAEIAGASTRQAVSAFGRALVDTSGAPAARNLNRAGPGAMQPGAPIIDLPGMASKGGNAVAGFTRGLLGRSTAAGASNASAAQFQQPTKANPVPLTPTSPAANIDRSENAIAKFGMTDAEFSRKKLAFAGF